MPSLLILFLITIVHTDSLLPCHSLSMLCNKPPALRETSRLDGYSVLLQSLAPQEQGQRFLLKHCYQSVKFYLSPLGSILPQFHNSLYNFCSYGKGGAGFQGPRKSKSLIWKNWHHLDILHPQGLHERGRVVCSGETWQTLCQLGGQGYSSRA